MTLKLFLIERTDRVDYDEYDAMVVRCSDAERAQQIANAFYTYFKGSDIIELGYSRPDFAEGIIFKSFNAG